MKKLLLLVAVVFVITGCNKIKNPKDDYGYDIPLENVLVGISETEFAYLLESEDEFFVFFGRAS